LTAIIAAPAKTRRKQPLWTQLWVWVLIAMALGIALGIAAPDVAGRMGPLGDAFIKLIRMLIAPIIFCTVVTGIAHLADMARIGRVAIKAIIYFEVMTTIALIIGLLAVNILQPGTGMNVDVSKLNPNVVEPYVKLTHEVGFILFYEHHS
jgi:aerobic C4-dicarboxylate transport protein